MDHTFEALVSIENLLSAWQEFLHDKKNKKGVREFQFRLMDNILALHHDLINNRYQHAGYERRNICDPKPRTIHIASVRDRLVHHAVYQILYPFFQRTFIADSFSCQNEKGTHRAVNRFLQFARIVSKNNTKTCWILKCDIRKFFASINQQILINMLDEQIQDAHMMDLIKEIIHSFNSGKIGVGLPLGNLTSQLFSNVYLNKLDQFLKHKLKVKYYIRYADDFVVFSDDKKYLENMIPAIGEFLQSNLKVNLHPDKVFIKTLASGMDFLGWVNFFDHRVLRTKTKKRMYAKLEENEKLEVVNSYLGLLSHGNTGKIKEKVISRYLPLIREKRRV